MCCCCCCCFFVFVFGLLDVSLFEIVVFVGGRIWCVAGLGWAGLGWIKDWTS